MKAVETAAVAFDTGYLEVTISGADIVNANRTIYDITPPASIDSIAAASAPLYINWTWTDPADADLNHVEVYIDGTFKSNVTKGVQHYNATYFKPNSTHTISTRTVDIYGNMNTTWINNTATIASAYTYVSGFLETTGTVTDFSSAQSDSDGGASATFAEETTPQEQASIIKHATSNPVMVLGRIEGGSFSNTASSDNSYLNLQETERNPDNRGKLDSEWNSWEPVTEVSISSLVEMNIGIEAYVDDGEAVYIQTWDFPNNNWNNTWRQLGVSGIPTTDTNTVLWYNITNAAEIQRFVNSTGNYRIRFADAKVATGSADTTRYMFRIDEFMVIFKYTIYSLNITTNITDIPDASTSTHTLQLRYNVLDDDFVLQIWNGSAWNSRTILNDTSPSYRNITLLPEELIPYRTLAGSAGSINSYYVLVHYLYLNANTAQQGRLYMDYQGVYSE